MVPTMPARICRETLCIKEGIESLFRCRFIVGEPVYAKKAFSRLSAYLDRHLQRVSGSLPHTNLLKGLDYLGRATVAIYCRAIAVAATCVEVS